ncbi:hypothetical protein QAD02_013454 [Eretmocerus hayati]|uniref:Uncharacterized protein n=1 Tax=Eretmocerus hayati TaxID=131215 RepID=A0ACC2P5G5_9HYME|nr:hypothetical protein QAD02_013454 [Eretmocerus hayati]
MAKMQEGGLRVSPLAQRNIRMIGVPPKPRTHKTRLVPDPLPVDGDKLPEFAVAHARTMNTVKDFTKFIIPIVFTRDQLRNCCLYIAKVASYKFTPRPALPVEKVNAVLNLLWEIFSYDGDFERQFGDAFRSMQPKRRTHQPANAGTA